MYWSVSGRFLMWTSPLDDRRKERRMELVSVVIPMYNAERTILRAIESVRAQTYTAWELILIDDGSTDGTLPLVEDYVARYGLPAVVVSRENRGVSHTRNEGIRLAQGGTWPSSTPTTYGCRGSWNARWLV